jgi:hypothetical protein
MPDDPSPESARDEDCRSVDLKFPREIANEGGGKLARFSLMRRKRRAKVSRLRRVLDLGLLVLLLAAAGVLHRGELSTDRVAHEKSRLQSVASFLEQLARAEREAKEQALVDEDGDGQGEYLFLSELTGVRSCRGHLDRHYLLDAWFDASTGFAVVADYNVTVYLPGEGAEGAVLDPSLVKLVPPYVPEPRAASRAFVAYAWPRQDATIGSHFLPALAITERGLVFWAMPFGAPYVGRRRPWPPSCFAPEKTLGDLPGRIGHDDFTWLSVEESRPWSDPNVLP